MLFLPSQSAFASSIESEYPGFDIVSLSDDKVVFDTGGFVEEVSVVRDESNPDKIAQVVYKNSKETTIYDVDANTEYSSLTGRTTVLTDITSNKSITRAVSNWKEGATHVTKISWKQIAGVGGDISTVGELAKALLSVMARVGILATNPVTGIVAILLAIPGIAKILAGNTPGGFKITTKDYYRSVTKGGKVYRIPSTKIIDISNY